MYRASGPCCSNDGLRYPPTNCTIQWIVIYPVDSVIHLLKDWGQVFMCSKTQNKLLNKLIFISPSRGLTDK